MASQENSRIQLPSDTIRFYTRAQIRPDRFQEVEGYRLSLGREIVTPNGLRFRIPLPHVMAQAYTRAGGISRLRLAVIETAEKLDLDPRANPADVLLSVTYRQMTEDHRGLPPQQLRWVDEIGRITEDNPPL